MSRTNHSRLIRIDVLGQNAFVLQEVGVGKPTTSFRVAPGDDIRFVAYRGNRRIDYQIFFKAQSLTPFTDVDTISMPKGGVSEALTVTTLEEGGMPFTVLIPSLGWQTDPEILVDGSPILTNFRILVEKLEALVEEEAQTRAATYQQNPIAVDITDHFNFTPDINPLEVYPHDTISWTVTQTGVSMPDFTIDFSATSGPQSPLVQMSNHLIPEYESGTAAYVFSKLFRSLESGESNPKDFTYVITMTTGGAPVSSPRTVRLSM